MKQGDVVQYIYTEKCCSCDKVIGELNYLLYEGFGECEKCFKWSESRCSGYGRKSKWNIIDIVVDVYKILRNREQ